MNSILINHGDMNKYILLGLSIFLLALTSCNKDINTDSIIETPDLPVLSATNNLLTRSVTTANGFHLACVQVLYPFSLVDVDGKKYNVADDADFNALVADSSVKFIVDFVYPLQIISEDDPAQIVIHNGEELFNAFAQCVPDSVVSNTGGFLAYLINDENSCFNLQYPVTLEKSNGDLIIVQDEASFNERLASDIYFFHFPIKLIASGGEILDLPNEDALFETLISCNNYIDSTFTNSQGLTSIGCYTLTFPCNVKLTNGTVKTIEDDDALNKVLLSNKFENFAFPITLIDENGASLTVQDEGELESLLQLCDNTPIVFGSAYTLLLGTIDSTNINGPCYTIQFPVQIEFMADSSGTQLQTITDMNEMFLAIFGQAWYAADVVFPVNLRLRDNTLVSIKNETELEMLIENCD